MRGEGDKEPGAADVGPRADEVAAVWRSLLGLDEVEEDGDFFALGGDSMLAIRMLVITVSKIGHELDYDEFFTTPTIRTLRRLIDEAAARD